MPPGASCFPSVAAALDLVVGVNQKNPALRVLFKPGPALGDVGRWMALSELELEEDEPSIVERRTPIDDTMFAEIEPVLRTSRPTASPNSRATASPWGRG